MPGTERLSGLPPRAPPDILPVTLVALYAYQLVEDAWQGGVADWCRAASAAVLAGRRAWVVTATEGQGNWMRSRLLCEGGSLFGVQFLDAQSLRRELCQRLHTAPPSLGAQTLRFLLRLYAMRGLEGSSELSSVARHPAACLDALETSSAAGWSDDQYAFNEVLSPGLRACFAELRRAGPWTPDVDRELLAKSGTDAASQPPLTLCIVGWDASYWPVFDLLLAAVTEATDARIYTPLPRGTSEVLQQSWLEALEAATGGTFDICDSSDFPSAQANLVSRLEGTDLDGPAPTPVPAEPELLVGVDGGDMARLTTNFVAHWLTSRSVPVAERGTLANRLAIVCPGRNASGTGVVRALAEAGIAVEDELGELPEPSLTVQIQRAILLYHLEDAALEPFLALIDLLNEYSSTWEPAGAVTLRRLFPLDPVEARRVLHAAFADVQHHDVRVLSEATNFLRADNARPLRELIAHLDTWPETLPWTEALGRWETCLNGLGLTTEVLEPLWSRLAELPVVGPVPTATLFQYLGGVLSCGVPPQRAEGAAHRFARVVVTTLEGAMGQTWGGVLFLDSNEGAWPIYPPENPFLDDAARQRLNEHRAAATTEPASARYHYLLTSSDRAQLEHFRFLEVLENCSGPLAFAGVSRDEAVLSTQLYPNEWALRCLVEGGQRVADGEKLLDRWRKATRQTVRRIPTLGKRESTHLKEVFTQRRVPEVPFDEYFLNFGELGDPEDLPFTEAWSARDLELAWTRPATFALAEMFGVESWRDGTRELARGEGWMIGRLVHRWLHAILKGSTQAGKLTEFDWQHSLSIGLSQARADTERRLLAAVAAKNGLRAATLATVDLPLWWSGVLHKAGWAARRCLESLAAAAGDNAAGGSPRWLYLDKEFRAELPTAAGRLRLRARCDVLLLDRPELAGAACQLIDIRTGSIPTAGVPSATQLQNGHGLGDAALVLLALEAGAAVDGTVATAVHPDVAMVTVLDTEAASTLLPALSQLAARQRSLCFGQRGGIVGGGFGARDSELLPLATTPVDPAILQAKSQCATR